MKLQLKKAEKKQVKLKIGFSSPSGFGKTYSALLMAYGVTGDWSKIAVIDSENDSASLYSDLGDYSVIDLKAPYSPERYIEAISTCEDAGMELIIIDSITHEWDGIGGCLDIYEKAGGAYRDWAKVTPRHKKFIDAILQSKCHVFTTVRRKQEYEQTKGDGGKWKVQKVGTKEVTREGFEYELTVNFEIATSNHMVTASKDRTGLFSDRPDFVITSETGKELIAWARDGVDPLDYAIKSILVSENIDELKAIWTYNKSMQRDIKFIEAKDKRKGELADE